MLDNSFGDSLIDKIALVAKLKAAQAMSNATAMTRLVSESNLELSKNCVMGMTCPTMECRFPRVILAGRPYIGGIIPETDSLPQCADRLGRDDREDTSASHTQASLANHSCSIRQIAQ